MAETFHVTFDGGEPEAAHPAVDAAGLVRRLGACTDFWVVALAGNGRDFVQFAPQPQGGGFYERWKDGTCLFSELRPAAFAEAEALRFMADPAGYRVGR